jgi:hypothetical protein
MIAPRPRPLEKEESMIVPRPPPEMGEESIVAPSPRPSEMGEKSIIVPRPRPPEKEESLIAPRPPPEMGKKSMIAPSSQDGLSTRLLKFTNSAKVVSSSLDWKSWHRVAPSTDLSKAL